MHFSSIVSVIIVVSCWLYGIFEVSLFQLYLKILWNYILMMVYLIILSIEKSQVHATTLDCVDNFLCFYPWCSDSVFICGIICITECFEDRLFWVSTKWYIGHTRIIWCFFSHIWLVQFILFSLRIFWKQWFWFYSTFNHFSSSVILHSDQIFTLHKNGRRRIHGSTSFPNSSSIKKSWPEVNIFPASFNAKLKPDERVFPGHALSNNTH